VVEGRPVRRFVVQEHTVDAGETHFDLMVEAGDVLVTVQLEAPPLETVVGRRSFDHRVRYLTYEGEISGDRGSVRIWDRGEGVDLAGGPRDALYRVELRGQRLSGVYVLVEGADGLTFGPEDSRG
jgi:hypothetical protein